MTACAAGDPAAFEEGLAELVSAVGPEGRDELLVDARDRVRRAAPGDARRAAAPRAERRRGARSVVGGMTPLLGSDGMAAALVDGSLGLNMLSLSNALAKLPLDEAVAAVRERVQARLREAGHTDAESVYLDHMLEMRALREPEPPVNDADKTYHAVARAADLRDEDVARARDAVVGSIDGTRVVGVKTMLCLLDHEDDFDLFCATATNLGAMVPQLLEAGELTLSAEVLQELSRPRGPRDRPVARALGAPPRRDRGCGRARQHGASSSRRSSTTRRCSLRSRRSSATRARRPAPRSSRRPSPRRAPVSRSPSSSSADASSTC